MSVHHLTAWVDADQVWVIAGYEGILGIHHRVFNLVGHGQPVDVLDAVLDLLRSDIALALERWVHTLRVEPLKALITFQGGSAT